MSPNIKYYYIYLITNLINDKKYIGYTCRSIQDRWKGHCSKSSKCSGLREAIKEYGVNNFSIIQLAFCQDQKLAIALEIAYIIEYDSYHNGYNRNKGGSITIHTAETKLKIGAIHKGRKHSKEHRDKLTLSNTGKQRSDEFKRKCSEIKSGNKHPLFGKKGINNPNYGQKRSDETKQKIASKALGRKVSPETITKREQTKKLKYGLSEVQKNTIKEMYMQSYSINKIAETLKMSWTTIKKILHELEML